MEKHGIEWEQLGTHNEHLSVYDYKKKMRAEEVQELEEKAESLTEKINDMLDFEVQVESFTNMFYDEEEYKLPEPSSLMSAKAYKTKIVEPLFNRVIALAKTAVKMCFELKAQVEALASPVGRSYTDPVYTSDGEVDMEASRRVCLKFHITAE